MGFVQFQTITKPVASNLVDPSRKHNPMRTDPIRNTSNVTDSRKNIVCTFAEYLWIIAQPKNAVPGCRGSRENRRLPGEVYPVKRDRNQNRIHRLRRWTQIFSNGFIGATDVSRSSHWRRRMGNESWLFVTCVGCFGQVYKIIRMGELPVYQCTCLSKACF